MPRLRTGSIAVALTFVALAARSAIADTPLKSVPIVTGLDLPTYVTAAPGDNTHLYILEKGSGSTAKIKVFDTTTKVTSTFLTLNNVATDSEEGFVGLAFDPNYTTNGMFYLNYVSTATTIGTSTIAQFHAASSLAADPASQRILLTYDQPQSNHNGGWIGFSPRANDDHNLYIASGDGGNAFDSGTGHVSGGNAQSTSSLFGKILRIHVDPITAAVSTPAGNPFATSSDVNAQKIFSYGLRNPFRDSFDSQTGTLYIGDVGQGRREEIDVQKSPTGGENYGWVNREGNIQTPSNGGPIPPGYVAPIIDYDHSPGITTLAGQTVIGGYVYRGTAIPDLVGTYIFGDYLGPDTSSTKPEVFSLKYDETTGAVTNVTNLTSMLNPGPNSNPLIGGLSSFGQDNLGNLYIVDLAGGTVFEIMPVTPVPEPASLLIAFTGTMALLSRRRRMRPL